MKMVFASMKECGLRMVRLFVPRWIGREAESICKELLRTGFVSANDELCISVTTSHARRRKRAGWFFHYKLDLTEEIR